MRSWQASREQFEFSVTLIPLRHGLLPYPSIVMQPEPAPPAGGSESQRLAQARAAFSYENHQADGACQIEISPAPVQQILMRVVREVAEARDDVEGVTA